MAHNLRHTVLRGQAYYYNRRVPSGVASKFGCKAVRLNLGPDRDRATKLSEALTQRLDDLWQASSVVPVDLKQLLKSLEPSALDLLRCTDLYLSGRDINERPVRLAVAALVSIAGNREVTSYTRADARQTVELLRDRGNKTATVRRRIQSLHAVLEYGFHESDADRR